MTKIKYSQGNKSNLEEKKIDAGFLGKIFGCGDNISKNVVGLIASLLTITIIFVVIFSNPNTQEVVSIIAPILTLAIGYLVGVKTSN